MTGGPSPERSKAMVVPSLEVTVSMKLSFRLVHAIRIRTHAVLPCSFRPVGRPAPAVRRLLAPSGEGWLALLERPEAQRSSLEPLRLHPDCRVYADPPKPPGSGAYELV